MAEINVERKRNKKPVWPWIVAVILIVGIIWLLAGTGGDEDYETVDNTETIQNQNQPMEDQQTGNPVAEFISFVEQGKGEVGLSHNYTQNGLQHLADALAYLHSQNQTVNGNQYLTEISNTASEIVNDTDSRQHADKIRSAFVATANFMQSLPESAYPDMKEEANDLMNSAEEIKSGELATDQADEIKGFFSDVADALSEIDNV